MFPKQGDSGVSTLTINILGKLPFQMTQAQSELFMQGYRIGVLLSIYISQLYIAVDENIIFQPYDFALSSFFYASLSIHIACFHFSCSEKERISAFDSLLQVPFNALGWFPSEQHHPFQCVDRGRTFLFLQVILLLLIMNACIYLVQYCLEIFKI